MSRPAVFDRSAAAGIASLRARRDRERASAIEPYRRDPLLPLRERRIRVWDPDGLDESVWDVWPNQENLIASWIDVDALNEDVPRLALRNVHVEKSRQEGDTTACAYAFLWVLTYWPVPLMMQHEKISEVADSGLTYDSFLGKIKFIWERWPAEIGRVPLAFTGGNKPIIRRLDVSTAFLVGDGQTPNPGRGGRYAGGLIDEAARLRYDKQAQAALTRAVPSGRIMLSTPHGEGNVYYELKEKRPRGWLFLRHHWTNHPLYSRGLHAAGDDPGGCVKCAGVVSEIPYDPSADDTHRYPGKPTSPWYDEAVRELTDEQVAQELDIDYAASLTARVYPEFSEVAHVADQPVEYDKHLRVEIAWDYGVAPTAGVICQESPFDYRVISEFEVFEETPEGVAAVVLAELRALGVDENTIALRSEVFLCVGDPAGESKNIPTARSLVADYRDQGFSIVSRPARIAPTINTVKRLLGGRPKPLVVSPRAYRFIRHMKANRWPVDSQGNRRPNATEPDNDIHNHMMRAFAYLVYWKWPFDEDAEQKALDDARRAAFEASADDSGRIDPSLSYDMPL